MALFHRSLKGSRFNQFLCYVFCLFVSVFRLKASLEHYFKVFTGSRFNCKALMYYGKKKRDVSVSLRPHYQTSVCKLSQGQNI